MSLRIPSSGAQWTEPAGSAPKLARLVITRAPDGALQFTRGGAPAAFLVREGEELRVQITTP